MIDVRNMFSLSIFGIFFYRFSSNWVYELILKSSVPWPGMLHACSAFIIFFYFEKTPDKTFFFHQNIMRHLFVNVKHKMMIHVHMYYDFDI